MLCITIPLLFEAEHSSTGDILPHAVFVRSRLYRLLGLLLSLGYVTQATENKGVLAWTFVPSSNFTPSLMS